MKKRKIPVILSGLTILSMCGGLLGVIIGLISVINIELIKIFARIPGYASIYSLTKESILLYPYVKMLLYGVSFIGALQMFRYRRAGFFKYSIAQIILLIIPYFMWNQIPIVVFFTDLPDMIFTFAFIGTYSLYFIQKEIKVDQDESGTEK